MLNALKLWYIRHQLKTAVEYESECRGSADFMRDKVIPDLESELRSLELKVECQKAFKAFKQCK